MKKGRPFKSVCWPRWATLRMKQLGLSEELLNEALKVGIRTFEVDCCQLSQRVKSVNETWNNPAIEVGRSDEHHPNGSCQPERLDRAGNLDVGTENLSSRDCLPARLEERSGHAELGPGQFPEDFESVGGDQISSDPST